MLKVLKREGFPGCCGIEVLKFWGWSKTNSQASGPRNIKDLEDDLEFIKTLKHVGLFLVALADEQVAHVEPTLIKFGYVPIVKNFTHINHQTTINLYSRVVHDSPRLELNSLSYFHRDCPENSTPRKVNVLSKYKIRPDSQELINEFQRQTSVSYFLDIRDKAIARSGDESLKEYYNKNGGKKKIGF